MEGTPSAIMVAAPDLSSERRLFLMNEPSVITAIRKKMGRTVTRQTLYRWMDPRSGCPAGAGHVILPVVRDGSRVVTTEQALDRFFAAVRAGVSS